MNENNLAQVAADASLYGVTVELSILGFLITATNEDKVIQRVIPYGLAYSLKFPIDIFLEEIKAASMAVR